MKSKMGDVLNKLRPDKTGNKKVVNVEQISAIGHSSDAVGWRPVPYTVPEDFEAFHTNVEKDVTDLISKANPDMYNVHFYDDTVRTALKSALDVMQEQRIEHKRSIHNIHIYQDGSLKKLSSYLASLEEELRRKEELNE